jgi:hypothetical protein
MTAEARPRRPPVSSRPVVSDDTRCGRIGSLPQFRCAWLRFPPTSQSACFALFGLEWVLAVVACIAIVAPPSVLSSQELHELHRSKIPRDRVHPEVHSQHSAWATLCTAFCPIMAGQRTQRPCLIFPLPPLHQHLGTVSVRIRHYTSQLFCRLHRSEVARDPVPSEVRAPHRARTVLRSAFRLLVPVERTKRKRLSRHSLARYYSRILRLLPDPWHVWSTIGAGAAGCALPFLGGEPRSDSVEEARPMQQPA